MWVSASDNNGRVNLDLTMALTVSGAGSVWALNARLVDGTTVKVSSDFATKAEADAYADELILDGS